MKDSKRLAFTLRNEKRANVSKIEEVTKNHSRSK